MEGRMMNRNRLLLGAAAALAAGCADAAPMGVATEPTAAAMHAPAPMALATVAAGGITQQIWPWTGVDFSGAATDPMNLVFTGRHDPRNLRAILMSLPGNRAGTPFAAFDCTWKDAIGGVQTTYSELGGWAGTVIQLECGDYGPFRYHLRLFQAGPWTLGQAHVEILIPDTHIHEVLSWEVGEQFVTVDFLRSGSLAGWPGQTGLINAAPSFREIIADVYNALPPELRALAGGPQENVSAPVPVLTNGSASILEVVREAPIVAERRSYAHDLTFNRLIPKPFCGGPASYVHVQGPFRLRQEVTVSASGALSSHTFAEADLDVRPLDLATGQLGAASTARVREQYGTHLSDGSAWASLHRDQRIFPAAGAPEKLLTQLRVGPHGVTYFRNDRRCAG
jgi:hypothetical protein